MAMRSEGGDVAAVGINNHVDVERELWSHGVRDKSVDGAVDGGANPQDECHPESGCTGCPADNQDVALTDDSDAVDPKWRRFSEWMHCVCLVTFDLELGQVMELIYPKHVTLSEQEKTNLCYLAFPDSNSGCMGDTQFHIRLRVAPCTGDTLLNATHRQFNTQCIPVQRVDPGHYWGFVYFRQTKDTSLPRGYFQKSFIIMTRLPFFNLFYEMCSLLAPEYFREGISVLERACDQICQWPSLQAGQSLSLPLLRTVYQTVLSKNSSKFHCTFSVPTSSSSSRNNSKNASDDDLAGCCESNENRSEKTDATASVHGPSLPPQVLTSVHEIEIFRSLFSVITQIHLLWELVLIGEPIVVMGTSPDDCSYMVQSLISLIAPLAYCAESRPYFTIHDSEFKEFTQRPEGPPPIIIGVTNPFFNKPLQNWPHIIRLHGQQLQQSSSPVGLLTGTLVGVGDGSNIVTTATAGGASKNSSTGSKLRKIKSFSGSKSTDCSPGVYTKYKPFLQKDKSVIKKILHGVKTKRPASVQSALLRRYLLELTQSFMIPLERYMASLMPLQKDISPFKAAPNPNQFKQDDFLSKLEQAGPHLTSPLKGDWEGLYKRFFRSPNFKGWYEMRELELRQTLQALQLQALSDADLNLWAQGKHEVEIVDMILKLKQKLQLYSNPDGCQCSGGHKCSSNGSIGNSGTSSTSGVCNDPNRHLIDSLLSSNHALKISIRKQLMQHLESMTQTLPDDLRTILKDT